MTQGGMANIPDSASDEKAGRIDSDEERRKPSYVPGQEESALAILQQIKQQDLHHPFHWPVWKKWVIISIYCLLQAFVSLTATSYVSVEYLIQAQYGGSTQVVTLGQSLFIAGNGIGPAFLGPLSDIGGRKWVYVGSILLYALISIGSAKALNLPMLIIFQFLAGTAGSTALSNVAGTIADLFGDADNTGQALALFVVSANIGSSIGSPMGEIFAQNPNMGLPWVFWLNTILGAAFALGICFIPETLPRIVIARAAKESEVVDPNELAIMEAKVNVLNELRFVGTMALKIMVTEPIVTFLAVYNGFTYGLLFLYLDGVFDVFVLNNGLSYLDADLTYLNFCVGVIIMFFLVPIQTHFYKCDRLKRGGQGRPEARFLTSLVTVWGFPISLFWFAFTSDGNVSFWSPVLAGCVLGLVDTLLYLSMLNYITDSYPNVAASAIAAFFIPSAVLAAAFAHIGIVMFANMSTTWAMATLAFVSLGLVALIYVLFFFGPQLRRWSKLARTL